MELGGNIELVGFNELDSSELIVLKKIIGSCARKLSDHLGENYENQRLLIGKNGSFVIEKPNRLAKIGIDWFYSADKALSAQGLDAILSKINK